jgi:hypothetical protein
MAGSSEYLTAHVLLGTGTLCKQAWWKAAASKSRRMRIDGVKKLGGWYTPNSLDAEWYLAQQSIVGSATASHFVNCLLLMLCPNLERRRKLSRVCGSHLCMLWLIAVETCHKSTADTIWEE